MFKKTLKKLKAKGGETFAEILIAILIASFGCMLIATMYSSAMNMNVRAAEQDRQYYETMTSTEQMFDGSDKHDSGKAVITDGENNSLTVTVDNYGDDENAAYKRQGSGS